MFIVLVQIVNMDLQEQISRIQSIMETSSITDRLLDTINKVGLLQTALSVGGLDRLIKIVGEYNITIDDMIRFIKEVVETEDTEYIIFDEINGNGINVDGDNLTQIEVIYDDSVLITHYEDDNYTVGANVYASYESLSDEVIMEMFDMIVTYYNKYR